MRFIAKSALLVLVCTMLLCLHTIPAMAAEIQDRPKPPMTKELSLDREHTAVLVMDFQNDIVGFLPEKARGPLLDNASAVIKAAREAHLPIIYVVVRFRNGYPEISRQNLTFSRIKEFGIVREGTWGADIDLRVAPQPGDIVVTKRRVGAFSTTDLESILRAKNITTLAMFGISTSGVVLSTVRWAADMDYRMIVVSDACADLDDQVHRVLTEKVFPVQATVVTTKAFTRLLEAK